MHILVEPAPLGSVPLEGPFPAQTLCGVPRGEFDIPFGRANHPVWSAHEVCVDCRWLRSR